MSHCVLSVESSKLISKMIKNELMKKNRKRIREDSLFLTEPQKKTKKVHLNTLYRNVKGISRKIKIKKILSSLSVGWSKKVDLDNRSDESS